MIVPQAVAIECAPRNGRFVATHKLGVRPDRTGVTT
jgi:hypothetical protein